MTGPVPFPPVTAHLVDSKGNVSADETLVTLELADGSAYQGYSFGAKKSVAGELVFQTGTYSLILEFLDSL